MMPRRRLQLPRWAWLLGAALVAACGSPAKTPPGYTAAATVAKTTPIDEKVDPFFSAPWPDDRRLHPDGTLATLRFPNPGRGSLMQNVLTTGDHLVRGFGLSSPLYLPFSGALDPASLPAAPLDAVAEGASVFLVNLDPGSRFYGVRSPLEWHVYEAPTLFLPGHVLAVRPPPGLPLEEKTRYGVVVTTRVRDAAGAPVGPEERLWRVLSRQSPDAADDAHYAPLLAWLVETGVPLDSVAGAAVFTTQPIVDELVVLRDWLEAQPAPALEHLGDAGVRTGAYVFEGTYRAPNLQHGDVPYALAGGEFVYDGGVPVPAKVEDMRVALVVPKGPVPDGGFPYVIYSHGTGGSFESVVDDIADDLAAEGIASVGIDQVMHGPRAPPNVSCFGQDVEICFFNPMNVVAGRNNARQAGLDNVTLRKMLAALVLPADKDPEGRAVRLDPKRVGFFGHSQGGFSGAPYLAVADGLPAAVLSGTGGHLTTTVLVRTDPINLRELAEGPLLLNLQGQESLDQFHPALALTQTLAEASDPLSYARRWVKQPLGAPKNLYVTSGLKDPYTNKATAEAMAAAGGIPPLTPVAEAAPVLNYAGLVPVTAPVSNDVAPLAGGPSVTAVFRQFPTQGHFPVFDDRTARAQWRAFFRTAFSGGPVVVPAP